MYFFQRGHTPLMVACEKDYIKVVQLLVEKYDTNINHKDKVMQSVYFDSKHHITCFAYIYYSQDGYTPSYVAVKEYNLDIIFYLKSQGADFTLKAKVSKTYDSVD